VKEVLIVLVLLGLAVAGYFVMRKLDLFLDENSKRISKIEENKKPDCVMLTENMSDEEIVREIHNLRENKNYGRIIVYIENEMK